MENLSSWSEYYLKAVICGLKINREFCRYTLALTKIWHRFTPMVAEGILLSAEWGGFKTDIGLVADICELFTLPVIKRPQDDTDSIGRIFNELLQYDLDRNAGNSNSAYNYNDIMQKYMLLDAVEMRFPVLPIKYYMYNASKIHLSDKKFAIWLKYRLAKRAETSDVYKSILNEFMNSYRMFDVFMK